MPGCRAHSLVPGASLPDPDKAFPASRDSLDRACLLALFQAAQHTLGEVAISQNTTSSTWQRGACD